MSIGAGLAAQIGFGQETTFGTSATPDHFYEFTSETVKAKKKVVQSEGLRAGKTFDRAARRYTMQREATGDVNLDFPTKGAGLLLANMFGSFSTTPTEVGTSTAYKQVHLPGSYNGHSLTIQKGVPRADGTIEPYTYPGCKITQWEFDCAQSDLLKLKLTIDSIDELTSASTPAGPALAVATYPASSAFNFAGGAILSGGTVSTSGGVTTVTGATAVAAVTAAKVTGSTAVKADRYHMGNGVTKAEQVQNAYSKLTGSIDAEFQSRALYDQYRSDTGAALQLNFTGPAIDGSNNYSLQFLFPIAYLEDGASPQVPGPDIIAQSIPFTALDDDTNPVFQVTYISTDTSL